MLTKLLLGIAWLAARANSQSLEISKIEANPPVLSCSGGPMESTLTVQVAFNSGLDSLKNQEIGISISGWRGTPPSSKLRIVDLTKNVRLEVSPAIAIFRVACGSETVPGAVEILAEIENPPPGISTGQWGTPAARVTIKVARK